jgi:hypothetical protein
MILSKLFVGITLTKLRSKFNCVGFAHQVKL